MATCGHINKAYDISPFTDKILRDIEREQFQYAYL